MKRNYFCTLFVLFVCCVLSFVNTACNSISIDDIEYAPATEAEAPARFVPYDRIFVQVPDSMCCVVLSGNKKIAVCNKSGYVIVPKVKQTRAEANEYTIVKVAISNENNVASTNTLDMVVAFEDTKTGDHDYNDLIFQAKVDIVNKSDGTSESTVEFTPIAFGASKTISLGVILTDDENKVLLDKIIYTNCRQELFNGDEGFINTSNTRKVYSPKTATLETDAHGTVVGISWYIVVAGEKLFAANKFQACLDADEKPQGLVLVDIQDDIYTFNDNGTDYSCGHNFWKYPIESVDVSTVYPGFDKTFLSGGDFKVLSTPVENSRYFESVMDEELAVNNDDCLYTIYHKGSSESESEYMTPGAVQLWANGPYWATCNIGAKNIADHGMYFSWASIEGLDDIEEITPTKENPSYDGKLRNGASFHDRLYYTNSDAGKVDIENISGNVLYDAARANWGGDWRMPTYQEYCDLVANTNYQWTEDYEGTGIPGGVFTSKTDPTKSIFLPTGGSIRYDSRSWSKKYVYIWLATVPTDPKQQPNNNYGLKYFNAWSISLQKESKPGQNGYQRSAGMNIRPVRD